MRDMNKMRRILLAAALVLALGGMGCAEEASPAAAPDTVLYYNPEGGMYYHLDPNCISVRKREYTPLRGSLTYSQLDDPPYRTLKRCTICGAPARPLPEDSSASTAPSLNGGDASLRGSEPAFFLGSFAMDRTYSYDHRYYAEQVLILPNDYIGVNIFLTETDQRVAALIPARAFDFFGICWERDTYTFWIQSEDAGIYGYEYEDGQWRRNDTLARPDYIVDKNDDAYRDHPELWDQIYRSPAAY